MRKGRWQDNKRQDWLEITEEEKTEYKTRLALALNLAKEVEVKRRQATTEVNEFIQGQDYQAQKHEEEKLPDAEQVIEEIE